MVWGRERDLALRHAAMAWLSARTHAGANPIGHDEVADFEFEGERFPLMDRQRGIRKPAVLGSALSIRTVYRAEGTARPYDDTIGPDGLIRYKWRGDDPAHAENRALRAAWRDRLPLIWFFGVGTGLYQPVYPMFIEGEEMAQQQFALAHAELADAVSGSSPLEAELARRYVLRETLQRVHQPVFRAAVMRAYDQRCAVCALRHGELLDAAHIVGDREELGIASVRNGLALCKIHHAAFDSNILGIRPDLVVQIRPDLLTETDGPMLLHGLQSRHGQRLMVLPTSRREQPDPARLAQRYGSFLSVS